MPNSKYIKFKGKIETRHLCLGMALIWFMACVWLGAGGAPESQGVAILGILFGFYASIILLRLSFFIIGYLGSYKFNPGACVARGLSPEKLPMVSILVPAYNEEMVIEASLDSLAQLNYPNVEVLVIDDGSHDNTYALALAESIRLREIIKVRVFRKQNSGKSDSLNLGLQKAQGEFVFCMDADTKLDKDSLLFGVSKYLESDESLAAVAGVVRGTNSSSWLGGFQDLEYLVGHFQKKFLSVFGQVSIVPGPNGLFRKSALEAIGGYEKENKTFAEDTELTLRLVAHGYRTVCEDNMVAYTETPEDLLSWARQRYRWSRGLFQAFRKNWKLLSLESDKDRSLFVIYILWEQILVPFLDFGLILIVASSFAFGNLSPSLFAWFLPLLAFDLSVTFLSTLNEKKKMKWLILCLVSRFSYSGVVVFWKIISLFEEWSQNHMHWDKLKRNGIEAQPKEIA